MFNHIQHALGKKILLCILLCSSVFTMATTLIQLYSDYRYDINAIEENLEEVQSIHLKNLAVSLWDFQDNAINQQLTGLLQIKAFQYVSLTTPYGDAYQAGSLKNTQETNRMSFDVNYNQEKIGTLELVVSYDEVYTKLRNKVWLVLSIQFIKTFLVALCIMVIVYWLVTRHIYKLVDLSKNALPENLDKPFKLDGERKRKDELDLLVDTLNETRLNLKKDIEKREHAESELKRLNDELEHIILERTVELEQTIFSLEQTQKELVQSEKMASLGQLVAGVSHEINTPLGIVVTATSGIRENVEGLETKLLAANLTKKQLVDYISQQNQALTITEKSLDRAINLINNFKTISVNQTSDTLINTQMSPLLEEITNTVQTLFKQENYTIELDVPASGELTTYPGAWAQIVTNLLMNSHLHGFEHQTHGTVKLSLTFLHDQWLFTYEDNGCGIPEAIFDSVFDPFVTTKRGKGGSGLGLNIVFNLAYSLLEGSIAVENLEEGCRFTMKGPYLSKE